MKKFLIISLFFAACNSDDKNATEPQPLQDEDQNRPTDTRLPVPSDTTRQVDTGDYDKVSDSIR